MHLFAKDQHRRTIHASKAQSGTDYWCLECGSVVRLRCGIFRRPHYFHLSNHTCHTNSKSPEHLNTQLRLQTVVPEIELEVPFPQIGRIADAVWEPMRLIFEVQCSPITREEVENRNRDYGSLGFQVVWIFHIKNFGRRWLSPAEQVVAHTPNYFTNINNEGKGEIFDLAATLDGTERIHRIGRFPIDISTILPPSELAPRNQWNLRFKGDLSDHPDKAHLLTPKAQPSPPGGRLITTFERLYRGLLYWQLEDSNQD